MSRDDCLAALELLQLRGVRCREWQRHPTGNVSAHSPWAVSAWDHNGLRVDFETLAEVGAWLHRYWAMYGTKGNGR